MQKNNVIEVGFKKQVQPVRIGGIDFEIKLGEKYRKKYMRALPEMQTKLVEYREEIEKADERQDYDTVERITEEVTGTIKDCVDLLLGDGAFNQLYEAADEDVEVVLEAFSEVASRYRTLQDKKKGAAYIEGKKR